MLLINYYTQKKNQSKYFAIVLLFVIDELDKNFKYVISAMTTSGKT